MTWFRFDRSVPAKELARVRSEVLRSAGRIRQVLLSNGAIPLDVELLLSSVCLFLRKMASNRSEKALLMLANDLLTKVGIDSRVKALADINATLLVKFLEQLCDETLTGVIREPKNTNDDIHNLKAILKTLSESLKISLSHISPEKIASGSAKDISNLLEIFSGLVQGRTANTDKDALVELANSLLEKAEMGRRVKDFQDVNSSFFVELLVSLCTETITESIADTRLSKMVRLRLPEQFPEWSLEAQFEQCLRNDQTVPERLVIPPKTSQDDEHNVAVVLQILEDVLGISLSHISPTDVVSQREVAIGSMLQVFSGFIEGLLTNESNDKDDLDLVKLANHILVELELNVKVQTPRDISASLFVQMLEQICDEKLESVIREPRDTRDEVRNVEVVLAALTDALSVSFSHVDPQGVVSGNRKALRNLLDVFLRLVDESGLVELAKEILSKANLEAIQIQSNRDLTASFFVRLLEQLCREPLTDVIRHSESSEDDAYNLSLVIRTLSDSLGFSLSHIVPENVVRGDAASIGNLLQVFQELLSGGTKKLDKDDALVKLANDLLSKANLSLRVKSFGEIRAALYMTLLERLCSEPLLGAVRKPKTVDEDLHNLEVVLRTLSDVLQMSLSHISPQDVLSGNRVATKHLLEVFYGLLEGYNERTSKEGEGKLLELANSLLCKAGLSLRVTSLMEINAAFFVTLLEHLCSEQIRGVLRRPPSAENDLHNLKVVLDTLSDVLRISLPHIGAQDLVDGNFVAIRHLLEVFSGLVEASAKAASDISEEHVVKLANSLLSKVNISFKVKTVKDIRASLLINTLEQLCTESLTGITRHPTLTEDEIRNVKVVITMLENLMKTSLSHIPASAVVYGNRLAIRNLLDLLGQLADGQETRLRLKRMKGDATVNLANELVGPKHSRVRTLGDINASFFVNLLRHVCSEPVADVIRDPRSREDEIHNVRVVINVLSDLLRTPLSHISPREIVLGNRLAIGHLLEVFYELPKESLPLRSFSSSSDNAKRDDNEIINLANEMLSKLHIKIKIRSIRDITASVFVMLFEGLCAEPLADVVQHPVTREDESHNVQAVIDTLSVDVLNTSLAHISGQDIVSGDRTAVANLLEVLYGLMEFILEEITAESKSEPNINGPSEEDDDPDLVTSEVIDNALQSQLRKPVSHQNKTAAVSRDERNIQMQQNGLRKHEQLLSFESGPSSDVCTDRTSELIKLGDSGHLGSLEMYRSTDEVDKRLTQSAAVRPSELTANKNNFLRSSQRADHLSNGHPVSAGLTTDPLIGHSVPSRPSELHSYGPPVVDHGSHVPQAARLPAKEFSSTKTIETRLTNGLVSDHLHSTKGWNADYEDATRDDARTFIPQRSSPHTKPIQVSDVTRPPQPLMTSDVSSPPKSNYMSFSHPAPARSRRNQRSPKRTVANEKLSGVMTDLPLTRGGVDPCCTKPETYQDYLMKYYGRSNRQYDEDASYLSDGCVDYNCSSDDSRPGSIQRELEACRRKLERKAKAVRFEDYLDDCATGSVGELRRQFKKEDKVVLMRKEFLGKVYEDELAELEQQVLGDTRKASKEKDQEFRRQAFKLPQTSRYRTKKYSAPVSVLLPRSRSGERSVGRIRKRSASASPTVGRRFPVNMDRDDILPHLLDEFPHLHLAPSTLSNLWRRAAHQIEQLSRADTDTQRRKTKAQEQIEDAERRQKALLDIMRKDLTHQERLKETKDRQRHQLAVKAKIREKRLQSARIRKYYDEFHVRQRSKMLKKRTKEELVFKRLFHDGLDIQKDRIREVKKYAKEQREQRAKQQKQELESLENYYRDQFALLAECLAKEKSNTTIRDKAQTKVLEQMKKELRRKMEKEIREFQQRLWQDDDNIYFRELDAERVRRDLRLAQCHSAV